MDWKNLLTKLVFIATLSLVTYGVSASPGRLDSNGGHINQTTGIYHCHRADCVISQTIQSSEYLEVVAFNVQFLGHFKNRDNVALAGSMAQYDIVVIQELVAPPFDGFFPDGTAYRPDYEARQFFYAMMDLGFEYVLSEEDTGTNDNIHKNSTATEWYVTFYKSSKVVLALDLPNGFLAADRSNHPNYERVPYATAFRTTKGGNDFVLVSVHLKPGNSSSDTRRRATEINTIASWVNNNNTYEKDFFVLGDFNFKNCQQITALRPAGFQSLNTESNCQMTNTNVNGRRPYDNVLFPNSSANGLVGDGQFVIIDLIDAMRSEWYVDFTSPYPGDAPYNHNKFRTRFSDHHPIKFRLKVDFDDD